MALYYFHLRDGVDLLIDEEGRQLDCIETIPGLALAEARSMIGEEAKAGHLFLDRRIDVEDEFRNIVHSLEFADAIVISAKPG